MLICSSHAQSALVHVRRVPETFFDSSMPQPFPRTLRHNRSLPLGPGAWQLSHVAHCVVEPAVPDTHGSRLWLGLSGSAEGPIPRRSIDDGRVIMAVVMVRGVAGSFSAVLIAQRGSATSCFLQVRKATGRSGVLVDGRRSDGPAQRNCPFCNRTRARAAGSHARRSSVKPTAICLQRLCTNRKGVEDHGSARCGRPASHGRPPPGGPVQAHTSTTPARSPTRSPDDAPFGSIQAATAVPETSQIDALCASSSSQLERGFLG